MCCAGGGKTWARASLPLRGKGCRTACASELATDFNPGANAIQVMTMKVSKGLEFPVVALPGVGHMPAAGEDEKEAARVFYVAATRATRATQRLVIGTSGNGTLISNLTSLTNL